MASKYEIIAALIDSQADQFGDDLGYHHTVVGVLRDLHDWSNARISDDNLAEAIYDRIAGSMTTPSFDETKDEESAPSNQGAEAGLHRVE